MNTRVLVLLLAVLVGGSGLVFWTNSANRKPESQYLDFRWSKRLPGFFPELVDSCICSGSGERIAFLQKEGNALKLAALDASNGEIAWQKTVSAASWVELLRSSDGESLFTHLDGFEELHCYDFKTGELLFSRSCPSEIDISNGLIAGGCIYYENRWRSKVFKYDCEDGSSQCIATRKEVIERAGVEFRGMFLAAIRQDQFYLSLDRELFTCSPDFENFESTGYMTRGYFNRQNRLLRMTNKREKGVQADYFMGEIDASGEMIATPIIYPGRKPSSIILASDKQTMFYGYSGVFKFDDAIVVGGFDGTVHEIVPWGDDAMRLQINNDGTRLFTFTYPNEIAIWDVKDRSVDGVTSSQ